MQVSSSWKSSRLLLAGVIALAVGWPGLGTAAVSTTGVKIEAGDAIAQAYFGTAVDVSGDTLVVGAPKDDPSGLVDAGSAYVFVRAGETWVQQAKLTASDAGASDQFGLSVAIAGDTVVIGAPENDTSAGGNAGSVYVFTRSGTAWSQEASITADDAAGDDVLGISVDISGETIVAGACRNDTAAGVQVGSAYVFIRSGTTWSQQASLMAGDGAANDYFGVSVAISGDTAVAGAHSHDTTTVMDAGAAYVFTRSGTAWSVQTSLTAGDGGNFDQFGGSVAVSSDTILVGSAWHDTAAGSSAGAAYAFTRSGTAWSSQGELNATAGAADDIFGSSVSLSGDTAVVGAKYRSGNAGASYVFARGGGTWSQQHSLTATDAAAGDRFGVAVAVDGDTVVVGADGDDTAAGGDAGSAWVFPPENRPPVAVDDSRTIAEDTTLTVGAPGVLDNDTDPDGDTFEVVDHTAPAHGSLEMTVGTGAFTYTPNADWYGTDTFTYRSTDGSLTSNWAMVTITVTPVNDAPVAHADPGLMQIAKSFGTSTAAGDQFGISVAISGDIAVVGSWADDDNGFDSGSAWVFRRTGSTWVVQGKLLASNGGVLDNFGRSVAISGDTIIVGAPNRNVAATDSGSAYVFTWNGSDWVEQAELSVPHGKASDNLGRSVSLSGDTALVGADRGDSGATTDTGAVHVFTRSGTTWSAEATLAASDGANGDKFGISIGLDGDTAVVGASQNDQAGTNAGAAYLFTRSGTTWSQRSKFIAPGVGAGDQVGISVAASGDTALVGSILYDVGGVGTGAAFALVWSGTSWDLQATLAAPDGALFDNFGCGVDVDGDTAVIGANGDDDAGDFSGAAYIFTRAGSVWSERQKLVDTGGEAQDWLGEAVGVSGSTALVSARGDDDAGLNAGAACFFGGLPALVTAEDTTITVPAPGLLVNDTDTEDATLTAATQVFAEHGTSGIAVNGSFWYRPAADWNGTDRLHYRATDGTDMSTEVTVTITVMPVNDAPVAVEDTATVAEDTTLTVAAPGVLANDTDAEGEARTLAHYTQPLHGTIDMPFVNGGFTYRPNENWYGTDTFTYCATDGSAESNWTTMTITVTAVNDAPVSVADAAACAANGSVTFNVLANDTDAEGGSLTATLTVVPAHGVVDLSLSGSATYTPAAGWYGTDTFAYVASDGTTDSAPAIVTLTVSAPPAPAPDPVPAPAPAPVVTLPSISGHTLTTPVTPSTVYYGRSFTVSSLLKPRHKAGLYSLKYEGYRYERQSNGTYKWVRRATWYGKNYNYSTYTKCIKTGTVIKLRGKWKVRAVHTHTGYLPKLSGWRYFYVR